VKPNPRDAHLEHFARRAVERPGVLPRGPLLVGVSGGPDSVALLHFLARHAERTERGKGWLVAAHVNHGLRGAESDADAAFVRDLAERWDVRHLEARVSPRPQGSEEAARRARYEALRSLADECGADRVATAHTADDQAETVLLRLIRGTGLRGLAGMPASGRVLGCRVVRPFLVVPREAVLEYVGRHGIPYRSDSSNESLGPARNFVRLELMPRIRERLNPAVREALLRAASSAGGADRYLAARARRLAATLIAVEPDGKISLDARRMVHYPKLLNTYLFRFAVQELNGDIRDLSTAHIDALLSLVTTSAGRSTDLPGGARARRVRGRVILGRAEAVAAGRRASSKA
jgi:tRNA(Ile)-lysidine synthase